MRDVLPLRAAGLVEVDVRIDPTRKDVQAGGVDLVSAGFEVLGDRGDPSILDRDVGDLGAGRGHHRAAADDQGSASRSRKRPSTSMATATSSSATDSSGLWLTPPRQRTKSMPTSVSADMVTASCPAPLV